MITATQTTETIASKQCPVCAAELRSGDRFCRHCGVNQADDCVTAPLTDGLSGCETKLLREDKAVYQSLSGALVNIVAQGVSAKSSDFCGGRGSTRLVAALATVPIWLLIVLLSPLEAYSAARAITKQL